MHTLTAVIKINLGLPVPGIGLQRNLLISLGPCFYAKWAASKDRRHQKL